MKRKQVGEQEHHWLDLGRMGGKARDPIKITLGQSESTLTRPEPSAETSAVLGKVWELHSASYARCHTWL